MKQIRPALTGDGVGITAVYIWASHILRDQRFQSDANHNEKLHIMFKYHIVDWTHIGAGDTIHISRAQQ